jgi:Fic family protein
LIVNLELLKHGYLPISIKFENRVKYYKAFEQYHENKDNSALLEVICDALQRQFESLLDN